MSQPRHFDDPSERRALLASIRACVEGTRKGLKEHGHLLDEAERYLQCVALDLFDELEDAIRKGRRDDTERLITELRGFDQLLSRFNRG